MGYQLSSRAVSKHMPRLIQYSSLEDFSRGTSIVMMKLVDWPEVLRTPLRSLVR